MMKRNELASPHSCLNSAAPDEPIFVLRAKDPLAAQTVRLWAAMSHGAREEGQLEEALKIADEMDQWRTSQPPMPAVPTSVGARIVARPPYIPFSKC